MYAWMLGRCTFSRNSWQKPAGLVTVTFKHTIVPISFYPSHFTYLFLSCTLVICPLSSCPYLITFLLQVFKDFRDNLVKTTGKRPTFLVQGTL